MKKNIHRIVRHANRVDFFFYVVAAILFLLLPISVGAEGVFRSDKQILSLSVRLFGLKILHLKVYFHEDGLAISLNGHPPKKRKEKKEKSGANLRLNPLYAVFVRRMELTFAAGGDPISLSALMGGVAMGVSSLLSFLEKVGKLDDGSVRVLPAYGKRPATVNLSIRLFTSFAMLLGALSHTKHGENYERRSDREYDG